MTAHSIRQHRAHGLLAKIPLLMAVPLSVGLPSAHRPPHFVVLRLGRAAVCEVSASSTTASGPERMLVIGASFTAGVGGGRAGANWGVQLAKRLGWQAMTIGVPGAGYTVAGSGGLGPFGHLLRRVPLSAFRPEVIVVQGGHDDWRVPTTAERANVERLVRTLAALSWRPKVVVLSVFVRPDAPAMVREQQRLTDRTIMEAAQAADPAALVVNPFGWHFARREQGLHPTAGGYRTIAIRVEERLRAAGIVTTVSPSASASTASATSAICSAFD